jgi:hypothetical protein
VAHQRHTFLELVRFYAKRPQADWLADSHADEGIATTLESFRTRAPEQQGTCLLATEMQHDSGGERSHKLLRDAVRTAAHARQHMHPVDMALSHKARQC